MSNAINNAIRPPMGNSLSPEPCALIPGCLRFIHDLRLLGRPDEKRMGDFVALSRGVR